MSVANLGRGGGWSCTPRAPPPPPPNRSETHPYIYTWADLKGKGLGVTGACKPGIVAAAVCTMNNYNFDLLTHRWCMVVTEHHGVS